MYSVPEAVEAFIQAINRISPPDSMGRFPFLLGEYSTSALPPGTFFPNRILSGSRIGDSLSESASLFRIEFSASLDLGQGLFQSERIEEFVVKVRRSDPGLRPEWMADQVFYQNNQYQYKCLPTQDYERRFAYERKLIWISGDLHSIGRDPNDWQRQAVIATQNETYRQPQGFASRNSEQSAEDAYIVSVPGIGFSPPPKATKRVEVKTVDKVTLQECVALLDLKIGISERMCLASLGLKGLLAFKIFEAGEQEAFTPGNAAFALAVSMIDLAPKALTELSVKGWRGSINNFASDLHPATNSVAVLSIDRTLCWLEPSDAPSLFQEIDPQQHRTVSVVEITFRINRDSNAGNEHVATFLHATPAKTKEDYLGNQHPLIALIAVNGKKPQVEPKLLSRVVESMRYHLKHIDILPLSNSYLFDDSELTVPTKTVVGELVRMAANIRSIEEIDNEIANLMDEEGGFKPKYLLSSQPKECLPEVNAPDLSKLLILS